MGVAKQAKEAQRKKNKEAKEEKEASVKDEDDRASPEPAVGEAAQVSSVDNSPLLATGLRSEVHPSGDDNAGFSRARVDFRPSLRWWREDYPIPMGFVVGALCMLWLLMRHAAML